MNEVCLPAPGRLIWPYVWAVPQLLHLCRCPDEADAQALRAAVLTDELKRPAGRKVQVSHSGQRTPVQSILTLEIVYWAVLPYFVNGRMHMTDWFQRHLMLLRSTLAFWTELATDLAKPSPGCLSGPRLLQPHSLPCLQQ